MLLVSPLAHVSQRQPFDEEFRARIESDPDVVQRQTPSISRSLDGIEVFVNIYDVTHDSKIQTINSFFANSMAPVKFGGLFHVGIEILNSEWAYGWSCRGTGVTCGTPRSEDQHRFRERVPLSKTKLLEHEVEEVLRCLLCEYRGRDYDVIERNCCHFAQDLCHRLGVDPIPAWVHRMGQICDSLRKASQSFGYLQPSPSRKLPRKVRKQSMGNPFADISNTISDDSRCRSRCQSRSKALADSKTSHKTILDLDTYETLI